MAMTASPLGICYIINACLIGIILSTLINKIVKDHIIVRMIKNAFCITAGISYLVFLIVYTKKPIPFEALFYIGMGPVLTLLLSVSLYYLSGGAEKMDSLWRK